MHRAAIVGTLATGLALALVPLPAGAGEAPPVLGTWRNPAPDGGRAAIARAIDEGVEPMGPLRERIARGRLLETNPPIPRLVIRRAGEAIEVRFGSSHTYRAPPNGEPARGRAPDGDEVRVTHRLRDESLVQRVSAGGSGGSTMVFAPVKEGRRLRVTMTITSRHLPGPIRYRLELIRENG